MKKVLFLSSALIMTVCGAFADDTTTDKKITGGAGTCTVDVLGVSADGATANTIATWSLNSYECAAGQYLDETTLNCTECPTGSYCPGGVFTVEANNSKTACPADYTSDAAATAESECYMGCELACSTNVACPAHSNNCTHSEFKTTGRQYVDATCNAYPSVCPVADFQCDTGYHRTTLNVLDMMPNSEEFSSFSEIISCNLNNEDEMVDSLDNGINDCDIVEPGQLLFMDSVLFEFSANQYDTNVPGVISGEYACWEPGDSGCFFGVTPKYLKNANFDNTITGDNLWMTIKKIKAPSPDTFLLYIVLGEYSDTGNISDAALNTLEKSLKPENWANVQELMGKISANSFASEDELMSAAMTVLRKSYEWMDVSVPWFKQVIYAEVTHQFFVSMNMFPDTQYANQLNQEDLMIGLCENNAININWNPDNGGASTQNMCMYDGPAILPSDPVKPGYTFMGWKLVE